MVWLLLGWETQPLPPPPVLIVLPYWSVAKLRPTLCDLMTAARRASWFFTISLSLLKLMSIESVITIPSVHTLAVP